MFVCLCHGISDKKIRQLVRSGLTSLRDLQANCKAGANCGSCIFQVKEIIEESKACESADEWPKASSDR